MPKSGNPEMELSKSTDLDGISPQFLKDGAGILNLPITHMVNLSIKSFIVQHDFKTARVTPIFKNKSKLVVGN